MENNNVSNLPPVKSEQDVSLMGTTQENSDDFDVVAAPSSKEVVMGAGLLLLLSIVFFFVRNAFVGYLVGPSLKRSPNNAAMAGWGLYGGLFFASVIVCLAIFSKAYMSTIVVMSLSIVMILCFVLAGTMSAKK